MLFDASREKIFLTRRTDNGKWCLPGGAIDSGEAVAEACEREVLEETGLIVRVVRLVGVYSSPDRIIEYADGNRYQPLALSFEVDAIGGELSLSDETTDFGYFAIDELDRVDLWEFNQDRIDDALIGADSAFIR
jgi:8-oxo-dGTP pyrophosphatase MutT (NUDIX family)